MTSKQLTPEDVHSAGVAAVRHALELMADAEILLNADRPRRAYALGVIAAEEAAKHLSCKHLLFSWTRPISVVELNEQLRPPKDAHFSRYVKLLRELLVYRLVAGDTDLPTDEDLRAMAKTDQRARHRVLYVEVAPDGTPMTQEGVDADEARQWVTGMRDLFVTLGVTWRRSLDDALAAARANEARRSL